MRRGAAERGVAELKKTEFQEEIMRQKEQLNHIETLYKRQLESAQDNCNQEKVKKIKLDWEQMTHVTVVCKLQSNFVAVKISL